MRGQVNVTFNLADSVVSLEQVAASLDGTSAECEAAIGALIHEFEGLAARVHQVLRLAGLTAQSIDSVAVPEIPAKVQRLIERTEGFVRDRLEADRAVLDTVRDEQKLVERLLDLNAGNRSVAGEIRMLSVLTAMEVARMGESGSGFEYLVQELHSASVTISAGAREFADRARIGNRSVEKTQRKITAALPRLRKQFQAIEVQLRSVLGDVNLSVEELSGCPAQLTACAETVGARISEVVSAIQSHDITRQQSQHARDALAGIAARIRGNPSDREARELAMGLRVQAFQLENIKAAMEAWSTHIDECLASILNVSQSRLERVAPAVLAQEEQLSARLHQIDEIERECERDSAEVAEAYSGLSTLVALVGDHARIARITRDRLRMLSFNSIIEARNLGSEADVMLEISRNITRIAAEWGLMAERSGHTRAELQQRMSETHAAITSVSQERDHALREARAEIRGALGDLRSAAQCAGANAAAMTPWTAGLHEQIEMARSISRSLGKITERIGQLIEDVKGLGQNPADHGGAGECDLAALEEEYSRAYTTEVERQVLRAALFGEAVPAAGVAAMGNDVELF